MTEVMKTGSSRKNDVTELGSKTALEMAASVNPPQSTPPSRTNKQPIKQCRCIGG